MASKPKPVLRVGNSLAKKKGGLRNQMAPFLSSRPIRRFLRNTITISNTSSAACGTTPVSIAVSRSFLTNKNSSQGAACSIFSAERSMIRRFMNLRITRGNISNLHLPIRPIMGKTIFLLSMGNTPLTGARIKVLFERVF